MPVYTDTEEFKTFLDSVGSTLQPNNSGYIVILTDKDCYTNGELVTGTIYIDLFQPSN